MGSLHTLWPDLMTPDDKRFFKELGGRIAVLRKENRLTQQQLAEMLGISQQTMAHYEVGRLRVPGNTELKLGDRFR